MDPYYSNRPQYLRGPPRVKRKRTKSPPNQEQIVYDDLLYKIMDLLFLCQGTLLKKILFKKILDRFILM
jgi:hypothetical protein